MRLERASAKAVKYAAVNFHYAKRMPADCISFSVFEDDKWCGVISFGRGNINIHRPFNLQRGEALELLRVSLNGKQSVTSKAVSIACKLVKKKCPLVRIIVSYADQEQGHLGILYQALNWYYVGQRKSNPKWLHPRSGKEIHDRNVTPSGYANTFGGYKRVWKKEELNRVDVLPKHKYIYPLDKKLILMCKEMSLPYPKAHEAKESRQPATSREKGGSSPTHALKNNNET